MHVKIIRYKDMNLIEDLLYIETYSIQNFAVTLPVYKEILYFIEGFEDGFIKGFELGFMKVEQE